ncbi:hypothetical protein BGX34_006996 [Mortierella sp. NVP85]|nr:hypothetical protein BGX34_006996 [Mortierella sp. NVP85]
MQSIGHDLRRGLNNFSLGGNYKNINKWLGELKNIDSSLKRLDKEITTNAKLIGAWGATEGEDLADVCQRMTQIMEEVGLIHQAYSIHHTAYRKTIKSLKTQEMFLDDNRKKKHDLTTQIAKHQKSSKENPIKLMELQSALERVSAELLAQELQLLQFKRVTIRDAFNAQFDAMIEFGEKMALIAGFGRQITNVIDCGAQDAHTSTLYGGSEYTAAALNQVKVAVTTWQAQPIDNPIQQPEEEGATTYLNRTPPPTGEYAESHSSDTQSNTHFDEQAGNKSSGYWNEVQMLKGNQSETSLNDGQGSEFEGWKRELQDSGNGDYISPPDSNPDASPFLKSQQVNQLHEQQRQLHIEQQRARQQSGSYSPKPSPSQQHYQNAAATVATGLRRSSDTLGAPGTGGVRALTPHRRESSDRYYPRSASPGPNYVSYQHQSASYDPNSSPVRGLRLGFSDPRDRSRSERMDNSDVYKSDIGSNSIAARFTRTPVIMDEK